MSLKNSHAFSGYSIDDADAAKQFYGEILGLDIRPIEGMEKFDMLELHIVDGPTILLYPKPNHQPATFTVLSFPVDNIDEAVDDLAKKGVEMIHYHSDDMPQDEKGICRGLEADMGPDIAWFTDPAGNTLAVLQDK